MKNISSTFTSTDALLLFSICYCQYHKEKATLGRILLQVDAINRSSPTAVELEDGLSRLMVGGYIERQAELFTPTGLGFSLFNDITAPQTPKTNVFEKINNLKKRLNTSPVEHVSKQLTITQHDLGDANREAQAVFNELNEKISQNVPDQKRPSARRVAAIESRKTLPMWVSLLIVGGITLAIIAILTAAFWLLLRL